MNVEFQADDLIKKLSNMTEYSIGFLDGAKRAEPVLLDNIGKSVVESLKNFIDANARVSPETLHHVYEWYQTGSPDSRLFDIDYTASSGGLSFNYTFSQSSSMASGSKEPFYNKASIMEQGIPVVIKPKSSRVLAFEEDGETIFTSKPITISHPGGVNVQGGFKRTINSFFDSYFSQSYLMASGLFDELSNPRAYKDNLQMGSRQGRQLGVKIGYEWVAKGGKLD